MAEQHIEAADVRDGIYMQAFGQAGEPFSITTEGECVVIRPIEKPADPESLRELLRRSLQGVGETVPHDADLPTLVAATEAFWTKRQRLFTATSRWSCMVLIVMLGDWPCSFGREIESAFHHFRPFRPTNRRTTAIAQCRTLSSDPRARKQPFVKRDHSRFPIFDWQFRERAIGNRFGKGMPG
jgi:hypothetical protein